MQFNLKKIRSDFPILSRKINNNKLVYFDNAASTQKPLKVIEAESNFYKKNYAAVHRGIHTLSSNATTIIENIRYKIAKFINASSKEIIFVKSTTEGINLVAQTLLKIFNKDDNIIITHMEHHSNIIPWQIIAQKLSIDIKVVPIKNNGELNLSKFYSLIDSKTKIVSITHISNVLGTINPVEKIIKNIKKKYANIIILIDGAQSIMHEKIDVKKIECDFYVFSGHKIYGPTGIGILYGKKEILEDMSPFLGGGAMVKSVGFNQGETIYAKYPWKFEAGTQNIAGIVGLGAALSYFNKIGILNIKNHEQKIIKYAFNSLTNFIPNIKIYGPKKRSGIISFNINHFHAYDIGSFLDNYGIAIRTGHHCAIPLMNFYKVNSMCRISFAIYNSKSEIDYLISILLHICSLLKKQNEKNRK